MNRYVKDISASLHGLQKKPLIVSLTHSSMNILFFHLMFILLIVLVLTVIFFHGVSGNKFLFFHDEFLPINRYEDFLNWFTRDPADFGTANTLTIILVTFFDRIFYTAAYSLTSQVLIIEKVSYSLKLFVLMAVPLIGFHKLTQLYKIKNKSNMKILFVSLWYSLNTFTVIYWHGNAFSLTLLIAYVLAPLALYYIHESIFSSPNYINRIKASIVIFLMSFALYFFAVFLFVLFFYILLYTFLLKIYVKNVLKNIFGLALIYTPFFLVYFLVFYDMFFGSGKTPSITGGETYGNLQGGIAYQLFMWFSWGIYTYWTPRDIFTFYKYYQSVISFSAPVILYILILSKVMKRNILLLIYLFLFLVLIFFIKGEQNPLGGIYLFLIQHVAIFRVFRSPDTKFSFGVVFVMAVMLLIVSSYYRKRTFALLVCLVIFIQAYPLYSNKAIQGENTKTSSDRVIYISSEYQDVTNFLNTHNEPYGYVMPYPPIAFSQYFLDSNKKRIGQDLLPKITTMPFVYLSNSSGMLLDTYTKLNNIFSNKNIKQLNEFPLRYVVIRRDVIFDTKTAQSKNKLISQINSIYAKDFSEVFHNIYFTVYAIKDAVPIIISANSTFQIINPTEFVIHFRDIKQTQALRFFQNYSNLWKLYLLPYSNNNSCKAYIAYQKYNTKECVGNQHMFLGDELLFLWENSSFNQSHHEYAGYANEWEISPIYIQQHFSQKYFQKNKDGSINFQLVLYFQPQIIFYYATLIFVVYFIVLLLILSIAHFTKNTKK